MSERQTKRLAQKEANRLKRRMIEKVLSSSRTSNVAFNLNLLVDGWLELESDPETFSLLLEDFGCQGAQVEEIYDLEQKFEEPVFGFIFLFKWLNNQRNDRPRNHKNNSDPVEIDIKQSPENGQWSYVQDENIISEMFFAKQMISNSCATHALISILLNCDDDNLKVGPILNRLKEHTKNMDSESKGYAIGNIPELAKAHNSHASYASLYNQNRLTNSASGMSYMISGNQRTNLQQQNQHEAYHFVSYVPINNRLYELDGLKNYPIDHGPFGPKEDWTEKFRSVIKQRLSANKTGDDRTISNDIRYNLMAVVPDRRVSLRKEIMRLEQPQQIIQETLKRVCTSLSVKLERPNPPCSPRSDTTLTASESGTPDSSPRREPLDNLPHDQDEIRNFFCIKFDQPKYIDEKTFDRDLNFISSGLNNEINKVKASLKEEVDKKRRHKIDNSRRTHNYEPFIMTFLSMLAKHGKLADLIQKDLGYPSEDAKIIPPAPKPAAIAAPTPSPVKKKSKYVSTGRPVGRPRKNPLPVPPPVKN